MPELVPLQAVEAAAAVVWPGDGDITAVIKGDADLRQILEAGAPHIIVEWLGGIEARIARGASLLTLDAAGTDPGDSERARKAARANGMRVALGYISEAIRSLDLPDDSEAL